MIDNVAISHLCFSDSMSSEFNHRKIPFANGSLDVVKSHPDRSLGYPFPISFSHAAHVLISRATD